MLYLKSLKAHNLFQVTKYPYLLIPSNDKHWPPQQNFLFVHQLTMYLMTSGAEHTADFE